MKLLMIGAGYVGLVSGTCFAEVGQQVLCLDIDATRIQTLNKGVVPIYEPGLEEMLKRNCKAGRLTFTTDYPSAIAQANICFIAVDTPATARGEARLFQVEAVARALGAHLRHDCMVVTKSTVPVGTTLRIAQIIDEELEKRGVTIHVDIVSNPEFLKEGNAVRDCMKPDRVIIGVNDSRPVGIMRDLYSPFLLNHDRLLVMDIASAELSKYACNAMLATRISFMNEMAALCETLGANVDWVRKAMGSDERIGNKFLYPGVGFGGSCLPKDLRALLAQGEQVNVQLSVVRAAQEVNHHQRQRMASKLTDYFADQGGLEGKTIGILGLSFKPDTDDLREASSLFLIQYLVQQQSALRLFDPVAMKKAQLLLQGETCVTWCQNELETAEGADALVLMTEWKQFRFLDFQALLSRMVGRAFFDGRNQCQPEEMARKGFDYISMGRQTAYTHSNSRVEFGLSQSPGLQ